MYTKNMALNYIKMVQESSAHKVFAVCDIKTDFHIGNVSLQNISPKNRSAELAIVIGERNFIGKGIGKEAGKLLIEYGFKKLNLHRIYCGTSQYNIAMQKLALNLKMKQEGIGIDAMMKNNKFIDIYRYAIINKDTMSENNI
ncbi:acetyltransferase [Sulfurimonas gotlandica GD1]|uniref:Acetyltransferase n=1 Tax=Sulfurimonas gotlandica (strain DSM 19862 / JCM 16533 / GD1) TaxID=929558 RepID=H1FVB3_SULGG|nr:acetyltransferase [Sulfurimonas gotlandica GD1]